MKTDLVTSRVCGVGCRLQADEVIPIFASLELEIPRGTLSLSRGLPDQAD